MVDLDATCVRDAYCGHLNFLRRLTGQIIDAIKAERELPYFPVPGLDLQGITGVTDDIALDHNFIGRTVHNDGSTALVAIKVVLLDPHT